MTLGNRLKDIRKLNNVSQEQFAEIIGVSKKAYWNYESDKRTIPTDILLNIAHAYRINTNWLISGEGEMILTEDAVNKALQTTDSPKTETLEFIHINPSCGNGTICYEKPEITPVTLGVDLIKKILRVSNPKNLKIFKASGDSMEPTIWDEDVLLVDVGIMDCNNSGIYILTKNYDYYCKRLRININNDLDIISDNKNYPIETVTKFNENMDIRIVGKVIKNLSRGL